jgi:hypothetical protein
VITPVCETMRTCALAACACVLIADSTAFVPPAASTCRSSVCKSSVTHRHPLMLSAAGESGDAPGPIGFAKDSSPQKVVKQSTRLLALAFTCNKCEGRNTYKVRCCELLVLRCLPRTAHLNPFDKPSHCDVMAYTSSLSVQRHVLRTENKCSGTRS